MLSSQQTKDGMTRVAPSLFTRSCPEPLFLFPWLKTVRRGKRFADVEVVKQDTEEALKGINIGEFRNCFEPSNKCLERWVASNTVDFEGD